MSNLGTLDRAARAAVALLVRRGHKPREIGLAIHASVPELGGASTEGRWIRYAAAVKRNGQKQSNRMWVDYSVQLKALARKVANTAEAIL